MRTSAILVLALVSAYAACSADSRTSPLSPNRAVSAAAVATSLQASPTAVPLEGRCDLEIVSSTPQPAPPVFRQVATGTCELTHLGHTAVRFVQVVDFAAGQQHSLELTYTASDGDVLRAASVGTSKADGNGVTFTATITFEGGTGRFAHAAGTAQADGAADLTAGTSHYTIKGALDYSASDSRGP